MAVSSPRIRECRGIGYEGGAPKSGCIKSLSSQEGLELARMGGVRAEVEAKRPEGEKCTIGFGD